MASINDKNGIFNIYKENRLIEIPYINNEIFVGIFSRRNSLETTEYSSFIKKQIEEIYSRNINNPSNISKLDKINRYYSAQNIKRLNKLLIRKKPSNIYNEKENMKNNFVNKKIIIQNCKCKNSILVETNIIKRVKKNNAYLNNIKNEKNKKIEIFGQDFSLKGLKESPPKLPELFYNKYNLKNQKALFKENEDFCELNRSNIPNIFYNHLIICENNISFNNKYRNNKISIVQRNKNKLLNIIYYSP